MSQELFSLLAERLLAVRKQLGLSQTDFAVRIGTSPRAYKNYELGLRDVPLNVVVGIHLEFGTDLEWLILGRGAANGDTADQIIHSIVFGLRSFEEHRNLRLSKEKTVTIFNYLFSQMANGRKFTEADIQAYLESTL